jgi:hypothetical protein
VVASACHRRRLRQPARRRGARIRANSPRTSPSSSRHQPFGVGSAPSGDPAISCRHDTTRESQTRPPSPAKFATSDEHAHPKDVPSASRRGQRVGRYVSAHADSGR